MRDKLDGANYRAFIVNSTTVIVYTSVLGSLAPAAETDTEVDSQTLLAAEVKLAPLPPPAAATKIL